VPGSAAVSNKSKKKALGTNNLAANAQREEIYSEKSKSDHSESQSGKSFDISMNSHTNFKISDEVLEMAFKSGLGTFKQKLLFIENRKKASKLL